MKLQQVGFVGWRGMVGSVLLKRMREENDFATITEPTFFTTSQSGQPGPDVGYGSRPLASAHDLDSLAKMQIIISCQGGDYTQEIHPQLRARGWQGYWIDAASTLRMSGDTIVVLDPINGNAINQALHGGTKDFIGGNCTVSLMMLAINGLLNESLVDWISVNTYQAISGSGAQAMRELLQQMGQSQQSVAAHLADPRSSILDIDADLSAFLTGNTLQDDVIGAPLAGNLLPWIDKDLGNGSSREESKGHDELNKILNRQDNPIHVESTCVRIGAMRSHSQGMHLKLNKTLPLDEINELLANGNEWVDLVPNEREASLQRLTPVSTSGTLRIAVGRVRQLAMGQDHLSLFTAGDQLLWGAAEPLRRMLRILHDFE